MNPRLLHWTCLLAACIPTNMQTSPPDLEIKNVCERPWKMVYAHSEEGTALFGRKDQLVDDVIAGKEVKVTLIQTDETYSMRVDNVNKQGSELCAESLYHLAHNGTHVDTNAPRRFYIVCTSGYVSILQESGEQKLLQVTMYWYTKDLTDRDRPVYSSFIDGSRAKGRLENLWTAGRTMPLRAVMRDRGYSFPMHNVLVDSTTGVVNGQNVKHLGQTVEGNYTKFTPNPYVWYSSWSTRGSRHNVRWSLDKHEPRGSNFDAVALDWHADTCWRIAYVHDANGNSEFGSLEHFKAQVREGHRVHVKVDDVSAVVSNVRVSGDVISAQILDTVVRRGGNNASKHDIRDHTAHAWTVAHTSGTVRKYEYLVGSSMRRQLPMTRKSLSWSVDTRPWVTVLRTEDQGRVMEGNPHQLRRAVQQGASIRINLQLDSKSGDFLTEPDSLRVDDPSGVVFAQALQHVSDKKTNKPEEYELQPSAFYWYLMISSLGDVRMTAWYVGKNQRLYDERAPSANVTWFANF
ncbi:uncharacterized protein LOC112571284 [Pomacea canaliculata]|uniref:uncharacterized protein LOC112571284 n=1 Tax=Pomacea canaliculata TaxID=400727 RepID=UPI000D73A162|nr:uncharacterized protein LOC112571284 [Pomacea canaliculata]